MTEEIKNDEKAKIPRLLRSGVIEVDESLCLTCRECEVACSLYHEDECNPSLSRIRIWFDDFVPGLPSITVCKQCDWPACYYACASRWDESAMSIDEVSGARYVDVEKCRGCGACMRACPLTPERAVMNFKVVCLVLGKAFTVNAVDEHKANDKVDSKRVYFKCDLCYNRPEGPVCVQLCPGKAIKFVPVEGRRK